MSTLAGAAAALQPYKPFRCRSGEKADVDGIQKRPKRATSRTRVPIITMEVRER